MNTWGGSECGFPSPRGEFFYLLIRSFVSEQVLPASSVGVSIQGFTRHGGPFCGGRYGSQIVWEKISRIDLCTFQEISRSDIRAEWGAVCTVSRALIRCFVRSYYIPVKIVKGLEAFSPPEFLTLTVAVTNADEVWIVNPVDSIHEDSR